MHLDKHVVKMPIELTQMLVTALVMKGILPENTKYFTHRMRNHPCSVWVRNDRYGFEYTQSLLYALCDEYYHRFGKHKSRQHKSGLFYASLPEFNVDDLFPHRRRIKPVPLAVKDYPKFDCPIDTYRNYYIHDKHYIAKWTDRPVPEWYIKEEQWESH